MTVAPLCRRVALLINTLIYGLLFLFGSAWH